MNKKFTLYFKTADDFCLLSEHLKDSYINYCRSEISYDEFYYIKNRFYQENFGFNQISSGSFELLDEQKFSLFLLEHSDKISTLEFTTN